MDFFDRDTDSLVSQEEFVSKFPKLVERLTEEDKMIAETPVDLIINAEWGDVEHMRKKLERRAKKELQKLHLNDLKQRAKPYLSARNLRNC